MRQLHYVDMWISLVMVVEEGSRPRRRGVSARALRHPAGTQVAEGLVVVEKSRSMDGGSRPYEKVSGEKRPRAGKGVMLRK